MPHARKTAQEAAEQPPRALPTDPHAAAITAAKATLRQALMAHSLTGATIALITVRHTEIHAALTAYQLALREACQIPRPEGRGI